MESLPRMRCMIVDAAMLQSCRESAWTFLRSHVQGLELTFRTRRCSLHAAPTAQNSRDQINDSIFLHLQPDLGRGPLLDCQCPQVLEEAKCAKRTQVLL